MGIVLITLGNDAAGQAGVAAGIPAQALWWPAWVLVAGVLVAMAAALGMLASLRNTLAAKPASRNKEFATMLCGQIWKHTDFMSDVFARHMRMPPGNLDNLRVLVRNLREDLGAPVNFVDQMRGHTPQAWPKYDLLQAFNNWGGQIKSIQSQLADLQQAATYPVVRDPVDKQRDALLVHHYMTEQAILARAIEKLRGYAFDVCAAAKPHLGKSKQPHGEPGSDAEDHPDCPCCRKRVGDQHVPPIVKYEVQFPPPLPPPPPPAAAPAPVPATCCCAAPRMCHCARACVCTCRCTPAPAPAAKPAAV
jgi:hypothetical protein